MTEEKDRPPLSDMGTEQLMVARVLFDALRDVLKSGVTSDELAVNQELHKNLEQIEDEISEIDVELLTRDDIPDPDEGDGIF